VNEKKKGQTFTFQGECVNHLLGGDHETNHREWRRPLDADECPTNGYISPPVSTCLAGQSDNTHGTGSLGITLSYLNIRRKIVNIKKLIEKLRQKEKDDKFKIQEFI
jgi:hypothetical protein